MPFPTCLLDQLLKEWVPQGYLCCTSFFLFFLFLKIMPKTTTEEHTPNNASNNKADNGEDVLSFGAHATATATAAIVVATATTSTTTIHTFGYAFTDFAVPLIGLAFLCLFIGFGFCF